jgi:hypothetical protein
VSTNQEPDWTRTADAVPPEGEVVLAMDSGGHVHRLKRQGRLWFVEDGAMYVYFVPTYWRRP